MVLQTARCLLIRAGVLRRNWVTAYPFAIYLRNRCFRDAIKCTSYEAFEGRQPQVGHIFPYGAFALVLKRDARLKADGKEADRAVLMRLNAITRDVSSYLSCCCCCLHPSHPRQQRQLAPSQRPSPSPPVTRSSKPVYLASRYWRALHHKRDLPNDFEANSFLMNETQTMCLCTTESGVSSFMIVLVRWRG